MVGVSLNFLFSALMRPKHWPKMNNLEGRAFKEAEAIWELMASECAHLSVLSVLLHPFRYYLQRLQSSDGTDARIDRVFTEIDVS